MNKLIIIPARAGSKGLPGKNIKNLHGKPLCTYSIEFAKKVYNVNDEICISTDDEKVIDIALENGIKVPFIRPQELSGDKASSYDVIIHAIEHYKGEGKEFDAVLLLQPTTPIRFEEDFKKMELLFNSNIDMVVTVKESKENPYFSLFETNNEGYLTKSKPSKFTRRQDCPKVYAINGSMYLMNTKSLESKNITEFEKLLKVEVSDLASIDIDTIEDWKIAEFRIKNK